MILLASLVILAALLISYGLWKRYDRAQHRKALAALKTDIATGNILAERLHRTATRPVGFNPTLVAPYGATHVANPDTSLYAAGNVFHANAVESVFMDIYTADYSTPDTSSASSASSD